MSVIVILEANVFEPVKILLSGKIIFPFSPVGPVAPEVPTGPVAPVRDEDPAGPVLPVGPVMFPTFV